MSEEDPADGFFAFMRHLASGEPDNLEELPPDEPEAPEEPEPPEDTAQPLPEPTPSEASSKSSRISRVSSKALSLARLASLKPPPSLAPVPETPQKSPPLFVSRPHHRMYLNKRRAPAAAKPTPVEAVRPLLRTLPVSDHPRYMRTARPSAAQPRTSDGVVVVRRASQAADAPNLRSSVRLAW